MTRLALTALGLIALCGLAPPPAAAAGPYDDLLKDVPPGVNTLALINVKAAHASARGKAEKGAEDHQKKYRSGVGSLPVGAEPVVVGAAVNMTAMTRHYQVALVRLGNVIS